MKRTLILLAVSSAALLTTLALSAWTALPLGAEEIDASGTWVPDVEEAIQLLDRSAESYEWRSDWMRNHLVHVRIQFAGDLVVRKYKDTIREIKVVSREDSRWTLEYEEEDKGARFTVTAYLDWEGKDRFIYSVKVYAEGADTERVPFDREKVVAPDSIADPFPKEWSTRVDEAVAANGWHHRSSIGEFIHEHVSNLRIEFKAPDTVLWILEPYVTEMTIVSRDGNDWALEYKMDDKGQEITLHTYIHWTGSHEFALRGDLGPEGMTLPFFPREVDTTPK